LLINEFVAVVRKKSILNLANFITLPKFCQALPKSLTEKLIECDDLESTLWTEIVPDSLVDIKYTSIKIEIYK
jgi:hypothetical protein